MKTLKVGFASLLLVCAIAFLWLRAQNQMRRFPPAKPAPPPVPVKSKTPVDAEVRPFTVLDLDAKEAALKDLRGDPPARMVVLGFWSIG